MNEWSNQLLEINKYLGHNSKLYILIFDVV